ncbi:MAG TPA: sugar phosphate isomerase/epimerase family protein [Pseudonocardiaceae bacterium]
MTSRPLAFSTLGCSGATVDEICALARDSGARGVELRVSDEEPIHFGLDAAQRAAVRSTFEQAGVSIICLASYVRLGKAELTDEECVTDLRAQLALARDLGAGGVRVFPAAGESTQTADERMIRRLTAVADAFGSADVRLLLETHDSHRGGADIARVLARVDHPAVGAIWDILHTWLAGETPDVSARSLAPWLHHVQVKNVASADDLTPRRLSTGVLPVSEVIAALDAIGYRGWLSLEWERRWHPAAEPLPAALADARAWLAAHT